MEPTLDLFAKWAVKHEGLFTFAHSPKHIALYQYFGFWPRFLTAIMSKPVSQPARATEFSRYSEVAKGQSEECLRACREMTCQDSQPIPRSGIFCQEGHVSFELMKAHFGKTSFTSGIQTHI
jgi:hypothetical protein